MQSTVYAATQNGLNVRSGPSTKHSKIGTLKYGQEITLTGKTADNWYQIKYAGTVGYILADYVSSTPLTGTEQPDNESPVTESTALEETPDNALPPTEPIVNDTTDETELEDATDLEDGSDEIGRASCRERV